jgi:uncharacterized delta-60 repeat protein
MNGSQLLVNAIRGGEHRSWRSPRLTSMVLLAAWLTGQSQAILASAGDLDPTFGDVGTVFTSAVASVQRSVATPDGGLLLVGNDVDFLGDLGTNIVLVHLLRDGRLDPAFGDRGAAWIDSGGFDDEANAIASLKDGGWILAGATCCYPGASNLAVYKLGADGALDPGFAGTGYRLVDMGGGEKGTSLALGPDGSIYVAGDARTASSGNVFDQPLGVFLTKILPSGETDEAFGDGGRMLLRLSGGVEHAAALLRDQQGRLVLVDSASSNDGTSRTCFLARFDMNGSVDTTFGINGTIEVPWPTTVGGVCKSAALQQDGRIIVAGKAGRTDNVDGVLDDAWAMRFLETGVPDPSFGQDGTLVLDESGWGGSLDRVVLEPSGAMVAIGNGGEYSDSPYQFALRLLPTGSRDTSFAPEGMAIIDTLTPDGGENTLVDVSLASDGGIYLAGTVPGFYPYESGPNMAIAARLVGNALESSLISPLRLNYSAAEETGSISVVIARYGPADAPASVRYATESRAGDAVPGEDFVPAQGTISWDAGDTSDRVIEISIVDDRVNEPNKESFGLRLSDPVGADISGSYVIIDILPSDTGTDPTCTRNCDGSASGAPRHGGGSGDLLMLALLIACGFRGREIARFRLRYAQGSAAGM